jgi:hypothetical protein
MLIRYDQFGNILSWYGFINGKQIIKSHWISR